MGIAFMGNKTMFNFICPRKSCGLLDLIHFDVFSYVDVISIGKSTYYILVIDDYIKT